MLSILLHLFPFLPSCDQIDVKISEKNDPMDNPDEAKASYSIVKKHAGFIDKDNVFKKQLSYLAGRSYWLLVQGAMQSPKALMKKKKKEPKKISETMNDQSKGTPAKQHPEVENDNGETTRENDEKNLKEAKEKLLFLDELVADLKTVCDFLNRHKKEGTHLLSYSFQMKQTKETVEKEIKNLLKVSKENDAFPVIYYTGHGERGTGNWMFMTDDHSLEKHATNNLFKNISLKDIKEIINLNDEAEQNKLRCLTIFTDCCFSGHWADSCALDNTTVDTVNVLASAPYYSVTVDGSFSKPLFSSDENDKTDHSSPVLVLGTYGHLFTDYPHPIKCASFTEYLLGNSLRKNQKDRIVVSCSFTKKDQYFCAILGVLKPEHDPLERSFQERKSKTKLMKLMELTKKNYTRIVSRTGQGYFIYQQQQQEKGKKLKPVTQQKYVTASNVEEIRENTKDKNNFRWRIISCCPLIDEDQSDKKESEREASEKNQSEQNQSEKNQSEKNQSEKNQSDKNQSEKDQSEKDQSEKNQSEKNQSENEQSAKKTSWFIVMDKEKKTESQQVESSESTGNMDGESGGSCINSEEVPGENYQTDQISKLPVTVPVPEPLLSIVEVFNTIKECNDYIEENGLRGYQLSGISYHEIKESYLVFMTHSPNEITLRKWFVGGRNAEKTVTSSVVGWIDCENKNVKNAKWSFSPYLVFKDPPSGEILICLTDRDLGLLFVEIVLDGEIDQLLHFRPVPVSHKVQKAEIVLDGK